MADPPSRTNPPSPISILLQNMGLTRDDLAQRTEQMREFLDTDSSSLRALSQKSESSQESSSQQQQDSTSRAPRRRSRTGSISIAPSHHNRSPSPSPVKSEPVDKPIPPRQLDTMQIVMERKRRQLKRDRKAESASQSREESRVSHQPLPPSSDSVSSQSESQTPHHYKYYSDRVIGIASGSYNFNNTPLPQTPTRRGNRHPFRSTGTPNRDPRTPIGRHIYSLTLPPSSPPSSPSRVVNLVSSPGPMRPFPQSSPEPDDLPFTLPPGPYSSLKPDYSYAAMIGQAIIASPEHRLPLQDIYEYITTVYPYYKRGEQTWMNSVRHALSTMAVFRKVPRGKMEGKSLWAVWDEDLPCFAHGGFRKTLCRDMMKQKEEAAAMKAAAAAANGGVGMGAGRKRGLTMEETMARNAKRRKKSITTAANATPTQADANTTYTHHPHSYALHPHPHAQTHALFPPMFAPPSHAPHPSHGAPTAIPAFYAPVLPGSHHQPYYQTYLPQPNMPAEVIFPPLPACAGYHRIQALGGTSGNGARHENEHEEQEEAGGRRGKDEEREASINSVEEAAAAVFAAVIGTGSKGKGKEKERELAKKEITPPPLHNGASSSNTRTPPGSSNSNSTNSTNPGMTPNQTSSDSSPPLLSSDAPREYEHGHGRNMLLPVLSASVKGKGKAVDRSGMGGDEEEDEESLVGAPRVTVSQRERDEDDDFGEWLALDGDEESDDGDGVVEEEEEKLVVLGTAKKAKGKVVEERGSATVRRAPTKLSPFAVPVSPTIERRVAASSRKEKQKDLTSASLSSDPSSKSKQKSKPSSPTPSPLLGLRTSTSLTSLPSLSSSTRNRPLFRPTTPPPHPRTPPRKSTSTSSMANLSGSGGIHLSPQRTPISHRGLHMSPSPSLAHYKSHLDPPPPASAPVFLPQAPLLCGGAIEGGVGSAFGLRLATPEVPKTPSRKPHRSRGIGGSGGSEGKGMGVGMGDPLVFPPVTPQKLFDGCSLPGSASKLRSTPTGGSITVAGGSGAGGGDGAASGSAPGSASRPGSESASMISTTLSPATWDVSPFRTTPSKGGMYVFDPHDPGNVLDDELLRLGSEGAGCGGGSPEGAGLFGFGRERGLLYESPGGDRFW